VIQAESSTDSEEEEEAEGEEDSEKREWAGEWAFLASAKKERRRDERDAGKNRARWRPKDVLFA